MEKISYSVLQLWQTANLTSKEVDFLLYISRCQNDAGKVVGVYYRDVCEAIDMSIQTFYNVKKSLIEKALISVSHASDIDYDIWITGNNFIAENYTDGYININRKVFDAPEFRSLKAAEKLLLLELMKNTFSNRGKFVIGLEKFYQKYMDMYHMTKRILRGYIGSLRSFFHVILKGKKYVIIPKETYFEKTGKTEVETLAESLVMAECRRQKIKDVSGRSMKDTCKLLGQYKSKVPDIAKLLMKAISESLHIINLYNSPKDKPIRDLRPKLVHKILLSYL